MKIKKIIPKFVVNLYHFFLVLTGAFWYGFPSRKMTVIGITGTKGKSTTVMLAGKILEEAGSKVGWISSATIKVGNKEWLNPYHMTMPGRFTIQRLMAQMVKEKCQYCLLEVTSEGVVQYRHRFISFDTAVFLNLRPEHIEAHGSFEKYREAKGKLFGVTKKKHILNLDDENTEYFLKYPAREKWGYELKTQKSKLKTTTQNLKVLIANNIKTIPQGNNFVVQGIPFQANLLGGFNIYNALAAIALALSEEVSLDICKKALEKIKTIPGRMEIVVERPFKVIVDLAHTPDSFEEVFRTVKDMPHNKIISIFGAAGGGRDKWKRPVLGKIAAQNSDFIILTNEDSYDERPEEILNQIETGVKETNLKDYLKIEDRREAIRAGLKMAGENDIVLFLGKGTEQLMVVGSQKIPWDDRNIVREELNNLKK